MANIQGRGSGPLLGPGAATGNSGGSFGGLGGQGTLGSPGPVYGDLLRVLEMGSGGGSGGCPPIGPGRGGGGIELGAVGALNIAGGLIANGGNSDFCGAGSGGGVLLHGAPSSTATGSLFATGGIPSSGTVAVVAS